MQACAGEGSFHSFYRYFLLRLFHEGLGGRARSPELETLLGDVPYLDGGLFEVHELERDHLEIQIPDAAFERLFAFFDEYTWHADERPLGNDKEINPDVLGYIFEKFINQKQMGAYYTKEDITGYIARNTIIPYILDAAQKECAIAFHPDAAGSVWRLLRDDPDGYLYPAVKRGVIDDQTGKLIPLPAEIAAGLDDVTKRGGWNRPADPPFALPTETWREHVARRTRVLDLREKLRNGELHEVDDLITHNLDIVQFAQDAIESAEGPELLRAIYKAIREITVLDPTCGSGAFLFAALNILDPLHDACLDRMQAFVADLAREAPPHPGKYRDFKETLTEAARHPSQPYFVLKQIVLNNLYGVDIMAEAVKICKLRLFLKLVAQLDDKRQIEPLPDIDFNIRTGNTLVGFATRAEVERALTFAGDQHRLLMPEDQATMRRIDESAETTDWAFEHFKEMQQRDPDKGGESLQDAKKEYRRRLVELNAELDRYLAGLYGIGVDPPKTRAEWRRSHQPFHWFVDFHGIMQSGGFAVIIGNPPYLELREVDYSPLHFASQDTGAIHAMCIERSSHLLSSCGTMSMIVPLSLVSTQRMPVVQELLENGRSAWYSNYSWRPGRLFDTVNRALTIFVTVPSRQVRTFTTDYQKWNSDS